MEVVHLSAVYSLTPTAKKLLFTYFIVNGKPRLCLLHGGHELLLDTKCLHASIVPISWAASNNVTQKWQQ